MQWVVHWNWKWKIDKQTVKLELIFNRIEGNFVNDFDAAIIELSNKGEKSFPLFTYLFGFVRRQNLFFWEKLHFRECSFNGFTHLNVICNWNGVKSKCRKYRPEIYMAIEKSKCSLNKNKITSFLVRYSGFVA